MVSPLVVVEAKVALQGAFELPEPREVAPSELDPPVVVQDRLLKAFHEAVGEGVTRLGSGVSDAEVPAGRVESTLELAAAIGQDTTDRVPGPGDKDRPAANEARQPEDIDWQTELAARGLQTRLGDAVRYLANKERGGPIAGLVVFTDGRRNEGIEHTAAASLAQ